MTDATLEYLREHPVYRCASPAGLAQLAKAIRIRQLDAGEILYRAGDPARASFVLVEGLVRVFQIGPDGTEVTVTHLQAPNSFGEKNILAVDAGAAARGYPENTAAAEPTKLLEIPSEHLLSFLRSEPACCFEMLRDMSCRFVESARREIDVLLPVPVRLASLLLSYAEVAGTPKDDGVMLRIARTQEELAQDLGTSLRSVQRALYQWQDDDIISRHKGWWVLKAPEALRDLCGQGQLSHVYRYPGAVKPARDKCHR